MLKVKYIGESNMHFTHNKKYILIDIQENKYSFSVLLVDKYHKLTRYMYFDYDDFNKEFDILG